eukprot:gnl/TRDRNA2_/TRDRNA2_189004_c0_seq1.p1 gnl/TRDRNA2_/TRDRNA2_189004_c0~~gnl/TRDRNA2_/TRDRNA2_189004_c0_seq1.p1  ORF type:complete len:273 (+),score=59.93 gnl/TRDRNA2_/TRDRNA2_189004_c0_seq1:91-909(+)
MAFSYKPCMLMLILVGPAAFAKTTMMRKEAGPGHIKPDDALQISSTGQILHKDDKQSPTEHAASEVNAAGTSMLVADNHADEKVEEDDDADDGQDDGEEVQDEGEGEDKTNIASERSLLSARTGQSPSPPLEFIVPGCSSENKCKACMGPCSTDDDCEGDNLICYPRNANENVPGCTQGGRGDDGVQEPPTKYCIVKPQLNFHGSSYGYCKKLTGGKTCGMCEGDCDYKNGHSGGSDCAPHLKCYHDANKADVPGCQGTTKQNADYCVLKTD